MRTGRSRFQTCGVHRSFIINCSVLLNNLTSMRSTIPNTEERSANFLSVEKCGKRLNPRRSQRVEETSRASITPSINRLQVSLQNQTRQQLGLRELMGTLGTGIRLNELPGNPKRDAHHIEEDIFLGEMAHRTVVE